MDLQKAVSDRFAFALKRTILTSTYREQMLSVGTNFLRVQDRNGDSGKSLLDLPGLSCKACGGDPSQVVGVSTAWFLLHVAAYMLDKVEDLEIAGKTQSEIGVTTNLSTGMIFIAEWILNHLELDRVDPGSAWDIQRAFHESVLSVCSGQHRDLSILAPNLDECWDIAREKSGAAFGLACYAGGRVATSNTAMLYRLETFGKHLGTIIQIGDDLEELEIQNGVSVFSVKKAPIFQAFINQISHNVPQKDNLRTPEELISHEQQQTFAKGSILYLRLEALRIAGQAKRELDLPDFNCHATDALNRILCHRPCIEGLIN